MSERSQEDFRPAGRKCRNFHGDPWHPREVADRLVGVRAPWCIVAGWAIDLFRGVTTRVHEDTEIAVPADRFADIRRALSAFEFDVARARGTVWPLEHEAFDTMHQTWAQDPRTQTYHLDVFREPSDGDVWVCRRDDTIRRPYADVIRTTEDGIPVHGS